MATRASLRATVEGATSARGIERQAAHYAELLERAYRAGDRTKLTRYASEYPGTEHPLEVRQLAASVRVAARRLLAQLEQPGQPGEHSQLRRRRG